MGINFTPALEPYKETGSFRFWCQKVLPLIYDDSLSYYELLCKVVKYLNDVISNVDGLKVDIDNLLNAYKELEGYVNNYFDNLDVQDEINNKLDAMFADGEFNDILSGLNKFTFKTLDVYQYLNGEINGDLSEKIEGIINEGYNSLYFKSGSYSFKNIELSSDLYVYGDPNAEIKLLYTQDNENEYLFEPLFISTAPIKFSIEGVKISGNGEYGGHPNEGHGVFKFQNAESIIINNVYYSDIYSKHYSASTFKNHAALILCGYDCKNVTVKNSTFTKLGGEETIWLWNTQNEITGNVEIYNNKIIDCETTPINLYSMNLFGDTIKFNNNYIDNVDSQTSVINVFGNNLIAKENIFLNSNLSSIIDTYEGSGFMYCENVICSNNLVKQVSTNNNGFIHLNSKNAVISNNNVECDVFCEIANIINPELSNSISSIPVGGFEVDSIEITGNTFKKINESTSQLYYCIVCVSTSTSAIKNINICGNSFISNDEFQSVNRSSIITFKNTVQNLIVTGNSFYGLPLWTGYSPTYGILCVCDVMSETATGKKIIISDNIIDSAKRVSAIVFYERATNTNSLYNDVFLGREIIYGSQFVGTKGAYKIDNLYVHRFVEGQGIANITTQVLYYNPVIYQYTP